MESRRNRTFATVPALVVAMGIAFGPGLSGCGDEHDAIGEAAGNDINNIIDDVNAETNNQQMSDPAEAEDTLVGYGETEDLGEDDETVFIDTAVVDDSVIVDSIRPTCSKMSTDVLASLNTLCEPVREEAAIANPNLVRGDVEVSLALTCYKEGLQVPIGADSQVTYYNPSLSANAPSFCYENVGAFDQEYEHFDWIYTDEDNLAYVERYYNWYVDYCHAQGGDEVKAVTSQHYRNTFDECTRENLGSCIPEGKVVIHEGFDGISFKLGRLDAIYQDLNQACGEKEVFDGIEGNPDSIVRVRITAGSDPNNLTWMDTFSTNNANIDYIDGTSPSLGPNVCDLEQRDRLTEVLRDLVGAQSELVRLRIDMMVLNDDAIRFWPPVDYTYEWRPNATGDIFRHVYREGNIGHQVMAAVDLECYRGEYLNTHRFSGRPYELSILQRCFTNGGGGWETHTIATSEDGLINCDPARRANAVIALWESANNCPDIADGTYTVLLGRPYGRGYELVSQHEIATTRK